MRTAAGGTARLRERRVRAASGIWLFAFVVGRFPNHALGLVSLEAMERGRHLFFAFWRLVPVEASLLPALLVHPAPGLARLWRRRTLRMRPADALRRASASRFPSSPPRTCPAPARSPAAAASTTATPAS